MGAGGGGAVRDAVVVVVDVAMVFVGVSLDLLIP